MSVSCVCMGRKAGWKVCVWRMRRGNERLSQNIKDLNKPCETTGPHAWIPPSYNRSTDRPLVLDCRSPSTWARVISLLSPGASPSTKRRKHYYVFVAKSLQLSLTLCDPMDCSVPGSSAHGILQARGLQWVAMTLSRGSSQPRGWTCVSLSPILAGKFFTISTTWEAHSTEINKEELLLISRSLLSSILMLEKIVYLLSWFRK